MKRTCPQAIIATASVNGKTGSLCDGLYLTEVQMALLTEMTRGTELPANKDLIGKLTSRLVFSNKTALCDFIRDNTDIRPKLLSTGEDYVSIGYDSSFLLKLYRKVELSINPDAEMTYFLSDVAKYPYVPALSGSIAMLASGDPIMLGNMEEMVARHGNGKDYVLERINNYIERILARDKQQLDEATRLEHDNLINPTAFVDLPHETQELLGQRGPEQARLLGVRVGEMHLALASDAVNVNFSPEPFSLHYQRSLFSGMQTLVRESYQSHQRNINQLAPDVQKNVEQLFARKEEVLNVLRRIYTKKLDSTKIRIHGDLQLEKILLTGRDIAIQDFGGDPNRSYSERRLKRSPLRDVASMIRSFYYTAYEGFLHNSQVSAEETARLLPYADFWAYHHSRFFMKAYLDTVQNSPIIPTDPVERQMMLDTFLLEKSISDLSYELTYRPELVRVPVQLIKSVMDDVVTVTEEPAVV